MKVICSVEVSNRALPSLNLASKKSIRSSLTIGLSPDKDLFVFHQTIQNGSGFKYKVKNNIINVFTKFINQGKATIRFKEPEHDLAIKCDPIQLKGFLRTLKLGLDGVISHQLSLILPTNKVQNKSLTPAKTKLKIISKEEYPVLEGFPRTLENLLINNANQKLLDSRILRLRNLRVLNMENNNLTTLPEQLGSSLPKLTELYLANNSLGLSRDWRWLVNSTLQTQLRLLDLQSNKITVLPDKVVKLVNLVTLKLDKNSLETLPNGIGYLRSLRYFSASHNQLRFLPGSIDLLKLESIDLSMNTSWEYPRKKFSRNAFQIVSSLKDIAARSVIQNRLHYTEATLPLTVIDHLESASFCVCGKPCFFEQPESYVPYRTKPIAAAVIWSSHDFYYKTAVRYCSFACYVKQNW